MSPIQIAAIRGIGSALIVGLMSFFGAWTGDASVRELVIAFGVPFLTNLALRFGLEGVWDQRRASGPE